MFSRPHVEKLLPLVPSWPSSKCLLAPVPERPFIHLPWQFIIFLLYSNSYNIYSLDLNLNLNSSFNLPLSQMKLTSCSSLTILSFLIYHLSHMLKHLTPLSFLLCCVPWEAVFPSHHCGSFELELLNFKLPSVSRRIESTYEELTCPLSTSQSTVISSII